MRKKSSHNYANQILDEIDEEISLKLYESKI